MRSRHTLVGLAVGVVAVPAAVLPPGQGAEEQPVAHGRFAGTTGSTDVALQVSHDGKAITSGGGGSFIKVNDLAGCRSRRSIALVRRGRRVAVDSEGRFSIRRQASGFTLRAHGRFVSAQTARLAFSVRPAKAFPCEPGPKVARLHRKGAPPFSGCRSQPAKTLLQNGVARIFNQRKIFYDYYFLPVAYGCLFSVDKRFELGLDDPVAPTGDADSSDARNFQLAGPYTAYVLSYVGAVMGSDEVNVVDLRDGTRVRPSSSQPAIVRSLVLKENGSVAWIQNGYSSKEEEVWAHDALGDRKLDSAPARENAQSITSLALTGSELSWQHEGEPRSATLH